MPTTLPPTPFTATVLGYPRIGPGRELKSALERYWSGRLDRAGLLAVAETRRQDDRRAMNAAGLDSVPVHTVSLYDHVLDTATLLGVVPERFADIDDPLDCYFAMARGNDRVPPLEMTKWFDTNYHYLVPEIAAATRFSLHAETLVAEVEARAGRRRSGAPGRHRAGVLPAPGQVRRGPGRDPARPR